MLHFACKSAHSPYNVTFRSLVCALAQQCYIYSLMRTCTTMLHLLASVRTCTTVLHLFAIAHSPDDVAFARQCAHLHNCVTFYSPVCALARRCYILLASAHFPDDVTRRSSMRTCPTMSLVHTCTTVLHFARQCAHSPDDVAFARQCTLVQRWYICSPVHICIHSVRQCTLAR